MMYPFMTLNDETEIVHSDMQNDGRVKVYIEICRMMEELKCISKCRTAN